MGARRGKGGGGGVLREVGEAGWKSDFFKLAKNPILKKNIFIGGGGGGGGGAAWRVVSKSVLKKNTNLKKWEAWKGVCVTRGGGGGGG